MKKPSTNLFAKDLGKLKIDFINSSFCHCTFCKSSNNHNLVEVSGGRIVVMFCVDCLNKLKELTKTF